MSGPQSHDPDRNIWVLASDGDITGVESCLAQGYTINQMDEHGYTPIHAASSYGHVDLIHFLVGRGATVNLADPDGDTPLHVCEDTATAQVLINYGANLSAVNSEGKRPLEAAEEDDNLELANFYRNLMGLPPKEENEEGGEEIGVWNEEMLTDGEEEGEKVE